jgi:hypothetical protein
MIDGMSEMKVQILKGLRSRLYPIDFLPRRAKTKLRGLIAVTHVDRIEDQAVDQQLSGVSRSVSDCTYYRGSS